MDEKLLSIISVDKNRQILLLNNRLDELLESYRVLQPQFIDNNNQHFWRRKLLLDSEGDFITKRRIKIVANEIIKRNKKRILDVGVGNAYLEKFLLKNNKSILFAGIDILDMTVQKYFRLGFTKVSKLFKLPVSSSSFEIITALEVVEHLQARSILNVLREFYRILVNRGCLIISIPINEHLERISKFEKQLNGYTNPNAHMRAYTKEIISWELEHCGFKVIKIYGVTAFRRFGVVLDKINSLLTFRESNDLIVIAQKK